jgi:hypothetical protein
MTSVRFKIICAWCKKVEDEGTPGAPESHGICAACLKVEMGKLDKLVAA